MIRLALLLLVALPASAQIETATQLLDSLGVTAALPEAERDAALDALWSDLQTGERIPFAAGDSAVFLWRGDASLSEVAGDHTGWRPAPAERFGDVWARAERFDPAARVDYKWVIDGNWILDPNNPHRQWSGFGANSELRMPQWAFPTETIRQDGVPQGTLSAPQSIASTRYGRTVRYRVWTPAGMTPGRPTVYVTDGQEYADDRLGALHIVLDNLVAEGRIEPPVVVFIDPRVGGQNLRSEQYVQNPDFAAFVARELVPVIDAAYPTRPERGARVILGTSLGGLFSAYLGLEHPDVFGRLAIQSPAFWVSESNDWSGPSIYERMADSPSFFRVAMQTGTIRDTEDGARRMRTVMNAGGTDLTYAEVPEGHSWGNWRATLDLLLEALLPPGAVVNEPEPDAALRLSATPNPTRGDFTLQVEGARDSVRLACIDTLGRTVWEGAGVHAVVPADSLVAGVYQCTAHADGWQATRALTVVR